MKDVAIIVGTTISLAGMCFAQNIINPFEDNGSLIALYHFNSGQGETIVDESENGYDGTMTNGDWVKGAHQTGIELTDPDGRVDLGDLDIEQEFTIECWVYPTSLSGENYIIQKMYGDSSDNYRLGIVDGKVVGGIDLDYDDTTFINRGERRKVEGSLNEANQWYYLALTWGGPRDGSYLSLYVNGERVDFVSAQFHSVKANDSPACIGYAENAGSFKGIIDEMRITDYALISMKIQLNYEDALDDVSKVAGRPARPAKFRSSTGRNEWFTATGARVPRSVFELGPRVLINGVQRYTYLSGIDNR